MEALRKWQWIAQLWDFCEERFFCHCVSSSPILRMSTKIARKRTWLPSLAKPKESSKLGKPDAQKACPSLKVLDIFETGCLTFSNQLITSVIYEWREGVSFLIFLPEPPVSLQEKGSRLSVLHTFLRTERRHIVLRQTENPTFEQHSLQSPCSWGSEWLTGVPAALWYHGGS